jgi:hypothetical protein
VLDAGEAQAYLDFLAIMSDRQVVRYATFTRGSLRFAAGRNSYGVAIGRWKRWRSAGSTSPRRGTILPTVAPLIS